jgi:hypothetical protein
MTEDERLAFFLNLPHDIVQSPARRVAFPALRVFLASALHFAMRTFF